MVLFWDESPCAVNYLSPCGAQLESGWHCELTRPTCVSSPRELLMQPVALHSQQAEEDASIPSLGTIRLLVHSIRALPIRSPYISVSPCELPGNRSVHLPLPLELQTLCTSTYGNRKKLPSKHSRRFGTEALVATVSASPKHFLRAMRDA
jgi:hypothetical protein